SCWFLMLFSSPANPRFAYSQSTSQRATTFSLARLTRLLRPWPPTPTAATFSVSLGAAKPLPSTCRGTIVKPAPVSAAVVTNRRRESGAILLSPFALTANSLDDNDYTPKFKEQPMRRSLFGFAVLAVAGTTLAAQPVARERALFDGKTTHGWRSFKKSTFPGHGGVVRGGGVEELC